VVILEQKKTAQNSLEEVNSIEKGYRKERDSTAKSATNKETSSKKKALPLFLQSKQQDSTCPAIKTNDSTTTVVTPTVPAVKVKTTENVPVEYIKLSPADRKFDR
jgi:hypothetical protein